MCYGNGKWINIGLVQRMVFVWKLALNYQLSEKWQVRTPNSTYLRYIKYMYLDCHDIQCAQEVLIVGYMGSWHNVQKDSQPCHWVQTHPRPLAFIHTLYGVSCFRTKVTIHLFPNQVKNEKCAIKMCYHGPQERDDFFIVNWHFLLRLESGKGWQKM